MFEADPVVVGVKNRLVTFAQINLMNFNPQIMSQPWSSNPPGFKFRCKNVAGLIQTLRISPRFALATGRVDRVPNALVFREVSQPNGLHLILFNDPNAENVVHLDSVSIVAGRDSRGEVVYVPNPLTLAKHLAVDKLHMNEPFNTPLDGQRW